MLKSAQYIRYQVPSYIHWTISAQNKTLMYIVEASWSFKAFKCSVSLNSSDCSNIPLGIFKDVIQKVSAVQNSTKKVFLSEVSSKIIHIIASFLALIVTFVMLKAWTSSIVKTSLICLNRLLPDLINNIDYKLIVIESNNILMFFWKRGNIWFDGFCFVGVNVIRITQLYNIYR